MEKGKIIIQFQYPDGKNKKLEREIDIEGINTFSGMEERAIEIGEEGTAFILDESLKKNRKFWLRRILLKIQGGLRMGKKRLTLLVKRFWGFSKGKS